MTAAVVFDLDGVLLDSEQVWNEAKEELVRERGGSWREEAPHDMMGMSSLEWSAYLHDELGVDLEPAACSDPSCDADHGYTGTIAGDDYTLRVSAAAEGADAVSALLAFADSLSARTRG